MKKVLIATWYLGNNYGTVLQAYSLKKFLEKEEFQVFMQYPHGKETHSYHDYVATFMNKLIFRLNTKKSLRKNLIIVIKKKLNSKGKNLKSSLLMFIKESISV